MTTDEARAELRALLERIANETGCQITNVHAGWMYVGTMAEPHAVKLDEIEVAFRDLKARFGAAA